MAMNTQGDIGVYTGQDPDDLYDYENRSVTFIYVPETNNLYTAQYPTTHDDMLRGNPEIYKDVFNGVRDRDGGRPYPSRGRALSYGRALLGRFALDSGTVLIAFWDNKTDQTTVSAFLAKLFQKFPHFQKMQDDTVLLFPNNKPAVTVTQYLNPGVKPAKPRKVALKSLQRATKVPQETPQSYLIGGREYSLADLRAARVALHTQAGSDPGILCHPDLEKYPELAGYRPASCGAETGTLRKTHPQNWRQAGREAGFPYLYTPETVAFGNWFRFTESFGL